MKDHELELLRGTALYVAGTAVWASIWLAAAILIAEVIS